MQMNDILISQLSIDYCMTEMQIMDHENHFSIWQADPGGRIFTESGECFLKAAVINGKIIATGNLQIVEWMKKRFADGKGAWFMEADVLREIDQQLAAYGWHIQQAHPFYIAETKTMPRAVDFDLQVYRGKELEQFRGCAGLDDAFLFVDQPKDELGVGAWCGTKLLGMAGATSDSDRMWQIGVNVMPGEEGKGVATAVVETLKNEILKIGRLPFYGTAMSHIASQRVALKAGFIPAWTELTTARIASGKCVNDEKEGL